MVLKNRDEGRNLFESDVYVASNRAWSFLSEI